MRYLLYPAIACLFAFTAGASPRGDNGINDPCDPPLVFSATICSGESIIRSVQAPDPASTYYWYADAAHTVLLTTGTSFTTPVLFTTTDYYIVGVLGGCTAEKIITITVNDIIAPILHGDTECSLTISVDSGTAIVMNPQTGYTYNWYDLNGSFVGTGVAYTSYSIGLDVSFWCEAVYGSCISPRVWVYIAAAVSLAAPYSAGASICPGETAALTANNNGANSNIIEWYDTGLLNHLLHVGANYTTPPLYTNTYYYIRSKYKDCTGQVTTITVTVYSVPPPVANDVTVCPGTSAQLTVQNPVAGTNYTWYQDPQGTTILDTGINYATASVFTPTTFYVGANDGVCSPGSALTPVTVNFPMLDSPIVRVAHVDFNEVTFTWQTISGAVGYEVSVNAGPFITPSSGITGTTHTVSGLSHEQTVTIIVRPILATQFCGISIPGHGTAITFGDGFYVPSAFTPNGDTRNDILKPIVPVGSILGYFIIYDRWGQRVFTTNKNGEGWDGKLKGKTQPIGTYAWICSYLFAGRREIVQKGTFTLLH